MDGEMIGKLAIEWILQRRRSWATWVVVACFTILPAAGSNLHAAHPDVLPGPHTIKMQGFTNREGAAVGDRAIGLMDKGQLSNVITNFGVISNFHTATPALLWPRNGTEVQHYSFGFSLLGAQRDG